MIAKKFFFVNCFADCAAKQLTKANTDSKYKSKQRIDRTNML